MYPLRLFLAQYISSRDYFWQAFYNVEKPDVFSHDWQEATGKLEESAGENVWVAGNQRYLLVSDSESTSWNERLRCNEL